MKVEKIYISDSKLNSDNELISYLSEKYKPDEIIDVLNESRYSYGNTKLDFDTTGGADLKGVKGLVKTIPGMALTTIVCWPLTLLMGLGIINERIQQRWEKRNSWLQQIFNPNYWNEYYANVNKDGSLLSQKLKSLGWKHDPNDGKIKDVSTGEEITPVKAEEKLKNKDFRFYWVTLSNGEVLRIRTDSEDNVRMFIDKILKETKQTYRELQSRKGNDNQIVYDVFFNDGEYMIWVAPDEKTAKAECSKVKEDFTNEMNKGFETELEIPKITRCRVKRTPNIELPDDHNYKISKEMPAWNTGKVQNRHIYEYNTLHEYHIEINNGYTIYFPAGNIDEAMRIIAGIFAKTSPFTGNIKNLAAKKYNRYKIKINDNDTYNISAPNVTAVNDMIIKLREWKNAIIKTVLSLKEYNIYKQIISDNPSYNGLAQPIVEVKPYGDIQLKNKLSIYKYNQDENKSEIIAEIEI